MNKTISDIINGSMEATCTNVSAEPINGVPTIKDLCGTNVVNSDTLKDVQRATLHKLKTYLSCTYGPMGSYTAIISGNNNETIQAEYSKDGLKVLKHILFDSPIELSLQSELRDICQHVDKTVGDGTTSAVILSSLIYDGLSDIIKNSKLPPRHIVRTFNNVVSKLQVLIESNVDQVNIDTIYDICMISTNGNIEVSEKMKEIYTTYGDGVDIDVDISNDETTKVLQYNGLTVNQGYSDSAYINTDKGTAEISNPNIYAFSDPIDTPEMLRFLDRIIATNIMEKYESGDAPVPTVIIAPMISRDGSATLTRLITAMYNVDRNSGSKASKPPILIITNLSGTDEGIAADIERLCNCKYIKKYINDEIQKKDQESGDAPTLENIAEFCGHAEMVVADTAKTKFIKPDGTEDGSNAYGMLIEFLEAEIAKSIDDNQDTLTIGRLKKRLRSLKANSVDYYVGGISVSDRDSLRDLVEDAVKNCKSASEYGVGRAANYEGLVAVCNLIEADDFEDHEELYKDICKTILNAYSSAAKILYSTVMTEEDAGKAVESSISDGMPYNVATIYETGKLSTEPKVVTSIKTDIEILSAISKIITMMATSNQCLLQTTSLNRY